MRTSHTSAMSPYRDFTHFLYQKSHHKILPQNLFKDTHTQTIYLEVTITKTKIRTKYWVPTFTKLVKRLTKHCYSCEKFHAKNCLWPTKKSLSTDSTNPDSGFKIIGKDYVGSFVCRSKGKKRVRGYILLSLPTV